MIKELELNGSKNNNDIITKDNIGIQIIEDYTNTAERSGSIDSNIIFKHKKSIPIPLDKNLYSDQLIKKPQELNRRTKRNKQMDLAAFYKKSRHFFIMNDGGKPVYARYGDEVENNGILATFSAITTKFTFFNTPPGGKNTPEKIQ